MICADAVSYHKRLSHDEARLQQPPKDCLMMHFKVKSGAICGKHMTTKQEQAQSVPSSETEFGGAIN